MHMSEQDLIKWKDRVGEYYAEFVEETNCHHVFHTDINEGHSKHSGCEKWAEDKADELNREHEFGKYKGRCE